MKRLCTTSFKRHCMSESSDTASEMANVRLPRLSLCIVGGAARQSVVSDIRAAAQTEIVVMNGSSLSDMVTAVNTPWWLLLYDNEFLSFGLLDALPVLLTDAAWQEIDGYTLFRRNVEGTAFSYHTRLLNSRVAYYPDLRRPASNGRYEKILNGWVIYDTHNSTN